MAKVEVGQVYEHMDARYTRRLRVLMIKHGHILFETTRPGDKGRWTALMVRKNTNDLQMIKPKAKGVKVFTL